MKICTVCNQTKSCKEFYKRKSSPDGFATHCKLCDNEKKRKWKEQNKDRAYSTDRERHLRHRYGITTVDYDAMLQEQEGKCGICGTSENYSSHNGNRKDWSFAVDHDHNTGQVRGLLCNNCNRALGLFNDCKKTLGAALKWLDTKDVA